MKRTLHKKRGEKIGIQDFGAGYLLWSKNESEFEFCEVTMSMEDLLAFAEKLAAILRKRIEAEASRGA